MEFNDIEIIVSEIDGVITDGNDPIDYMNHTIFKTYCLRDFEAISMLKTHFTFVFLSAETAVNYNIMRMRNIPAYFSTTKEDKLEILTKKILPHYNTRPTNLLYIGSMLTDIPCMHLAQISVASTTAIGVFQEAMYQIPVAAGSGVISSVASMLRTEMAVRKFKE